MSKDKPIIATEPRQTLVDLFAEFSESPVEFLQYDDGYRRWKYTYAQVGLAARHFAARLAGHNIHKGDKVIIWSENRPEWITAFWGCVLAGVIVVPIDFRASAGFLHRVQQIVDARMILIGEEVRLPAEEGAALVCRLRDLEWPTTRCEIPSVSIDKNDLVEIVFTSGATGEPKGVLITHRNILADIVSPAQIIRTYRKWFLPVLPLRFLSLIPLSHMFGQVVTMFLVPLIPGTAVFMHGYSPHEIVRQIRMRNVSVLVGVPKILELLRKHFLAQFHRNSWSAFSYVPLDLPLVAIPARALVAWMEVLGFYRRSGTAPKGGRGVLVRAWIRGHSRLRTHGDSACRYLQQPLRHCGRYSRQADCWRGGKDCAGRRDTCAR